MRAPETTSLGGGVHRVTLPLPWALDHVHCYAVEDADGWTVVDCGLGGAGAARRWREALAALGARDVRRVVVTHFHPDHVGGSGPLAALTGAEVLQGRLDAELSRLAWGSGRRPGAFAAFLRRNGMPEQEAEHSTADEHAIPVDCARPSRLLDEGDVLDLGGERFRVLVLPGHAEGHLALLGERTGRMFGGDVLLEEITPNIGRWEATPPDPLGRYLETLERIEALAPAVVYPGHRGVVSDPIRRAAEIRRHHEARLEEHVAALRAGAETPYDVSCRVWGEELGSHERRFALVEAIGHLERLEREGRAIEAAPGLWRAA